MKFTRRDLLVVPQTSRLLFRLSPGGRGRPGLRQRRWPGRVRGLLGARAFGPQRPEPEIPPGKAGGQNVHPPSLGARTFGPHKKSHQMAGLLGFPPHPNPLPPGERGLRRTADVSSAFLASPVVGEARCSNRLTCYKYSGTGYFLWARARVRMRAVLSRIIRGSTGRPSNRQRRTSLPEIKTGFSFGWLSIRSTRPMDS